MFTGPITPALTGDLYKQFINEIGAFRAWIYDGSAWIEYADMSEITFEIPWPDQPAEDDDVYWSGPTKWTMVASEWQIQSNHIIQPPQTQPPAAPESPDFPTDPPPEHGDTHTDQHGNTWWWYDGVWNTHPDTVVGDIYTTDVNTVDTESFDINDMLKVIPDIDLMELKTQKDVNWAIANALSALDSQVEINSGRLDDITMLVPGASYDYERSSQYVRPPRSGAFYLGTDFAFTDVFGDARYVYIHHIDQTGTEHTFENLDVGDSIIIEHHLDAQNFGRYQVTSVTHNSDDSIIGITPVSHKGSLEPDTRYDIIAFPDLNVADKPSYDYVNNNFIKVNGDTDITAGTKITLDNLRVPAFVIKGHGGQGFTLQNGSGSSLMYVYSSDVRLTNNTGSHTKSLLNRSQGDERWGLKEDYVEKAGDDMSGALTTPELKTTQLNSGQDTNLTISRNSQSRILVGSDIVAMYRPLRLAQEGTADDHAMTKKYIDDRVDAIGEGPQGPRGYTGSRGATGYVGSKGNTGPGGYTGSKGDRGYTGSRGNTGSSGVQIELYNSSSPASSKPRGTLLMTNTNNLYVYI